MGELGPAILPSKRRIYYYVRCAHKLPASRLCAAAGATSQPYKQPVIKQPSTVQEQCDQRRKMQPF
jgi:hypothetical protein